MSRSQEPYDQELNALEAELAALVPRAERLSPGKVMFLAGQASAAGTMPRRPMRAAWAWPAAFSGMTGVAVVLGVMLFARPAPQVIERVVYVSQEPVVSAEATLAAAPASAETHESVFDQKPLQSRQLSAPQPTWLAFLNRWFASSEPAEPVAETAYFAIRERIVLEGWDAWKEPAEAGIKRGHDQPTSYRDFYKRLLEDRG